jgi:membrane protein YdbS with pleckstrin-like domain
MSFRGRRLRKYLSPGEQVVATSRPHWVVLLGPALIWIGSLMALSVVAVLMSTWLSVPEQWINLLAAVPAVLATLRMALCAGRWAATRLIITDQKVLVRSGILACKVNAVPLARVTDTTLSRGLWGRILGYGSITLRSSGNPNLPALRQVPSAVQTYQLLQELLIPEHRRVSRPRDGWLLDPQEQDTGPLPTVLI